MNGVTIGKEIDAKSFDDYVRERLQEIRPRGRIKPITRTFLNEWKIMRRQDSQLKIACIARNLREAERIMDVNRRWILRITRKQWVEIKRCLNG